MAGALVGGEGAGLPRTLVSCGLHFGCVRRLVRLKRAFELRLAFERLVNAAFK